jgi:sugar lactone lactonase YvrE
MKIEVVLDAGATIGESPTWASAENALYWIDVKKPALYRYDPATERQQSWPMTSDIGAFAIVSEPSGAVVALRKGIFRLDFASGSLTLLAQPPFDPSLFRFNEGACDAGGRFWVGVMFDPVEGVHPPQKSSLHSFDLQAGLRPERDTAELHNGMAWSRNGRQFYLTHSERQEIFAYTFDPEGGRLGTRHVFARVPKADGLPDGAAVDIQRWLLVCAARRWSIATIYGRRRGGPRHRTPGESADHVRLCRRGS